jgi:hypothetical protein
MPTGDSEQQAGVIRQLFARCSTIIRPLFDHCSTAVRPQFDH